jgi:hypothetical protein
VLGQRPPIDPLCLGPPLPIPPNDRTPQSPPREERVIKPSTIDKHHNLDGYRHNDDILPRRPLLHATPALINGPLLIICAFHIILLLLLLLLLLLIPNVHLLASLVGLHPKAAQLHLFRGLGFRVLDSGIEIWSASIRRLLSCTCFAVWGLGFGVWSVSVHRLFFCTSGSDAGFEPTFSIPRRWYPGPFMSPPRWLLSLSLKLTCV